MKLAMNMLLWTDDITDASRWPLLEQIAEAGYDGVEVPIFSLDPEPYRALGTRLAELELTALALTAPMPDANPISPDADVRRAADERGRRALECAAAVGAEIVAGPFQAAPTVFSGSAPSEQEREWARVAVRGLCEAADPLGITLALESLNHFEHYLTTTAAETAALCREIAHPRCRMLYDTFHAHMEEKDLGEAIRGCADVLAYVHLSESDRSTPGSGQVDWATTLRTLREVGYDGWFTIEAFGTSHPELSRQMRMWRPRFESEGQLLRDGERFLRGAWARAAAGVSRP
jgi:D-psicose/D-tagatose/L-ribulose 3-epimerase